MQDLDAVLIVFFLILNYIPLDSGLKGAMYIHKHGLKQCLFYNTGVWGDSVDKAQHFPPATPLKQIHDGGGVLLLYIGTYTGPLHRGTAAVENHCNMRESAASPLY